MVANISTGYDVYGALAFNQQKVDKGAAVAKKYSKQLDIIEAARRILAEQKLE